MTDQTPGSGRLTWLVGLGSLVPPLLTVHALVAWRGPQYWPHAAALTWYGVATCAVVWLVRRRGWRPGFVLALATLNLLALTPEVALRLGGFRWETGIQFGYPRPHQFLHLAPDEDLFWTLPPTAPGVNAQGFRTYQLPRSRQPGQIRITVLGDSVPFQGYPEIVETLLESRPGDPRAYEVVNLSLTGYSSHQGRVLTRKYADLVPSDVVVISYGWNDHWLARGAVDSETVVGTDLSSLGRLRARLFHRVRLLQAIGYLASSLGPRPEPTGTTVRVPPEAYGANLRFMAERWSQQGARPLLITPPAAHARLGVPDYLLDMGFAVDGDQVIGLHRTYNQIVRQVAADRGWTVLDLETELGSLADDELRRIFLEDGGHLTPAGQALVAQRVAETVLEILDPPQPAP